MRSERVRWAMVVLGALGAARWAGADVRLPPLISDHLVLRASDATRVWGEADAGEAVTVAIAGRSAKTTAGVDGRWEVRLDLSKAGAGPFEMTVRGNNEVKVSDVVLGEVWLASGQSNMGFGMRNALGTAEEVARPVNPQFRFYRVRLGAQDAPQEKSPRGEWIIMGPTTVTGVSAVAYHFARRVQEGLGAPVGVIESAWGGSAAEAWISKESLDSVPEIKTASERVLAKAVEARATRERFQKEFPVWVKTHGREDKPPADVAAFAGLDVDKAGWVPVRMSGAVTAEGLPATGAVWFRREVDIPENLAGKRLAMRVGTIDGIEQVYWNGTLVRGRKPSDYTGPSRLTVDFPPDAIKAGRNVLAIRVYLPTGPMVLTGENIMITGVKNIPEGWTAKAEYALPDPGALPPPPPAVIAAPDENQTAAYLYNAMIHPYRRATLSGFIWYQGESNAGRAWQHRTTFPLLINDWRKQFGQPELPFYFCQLPNFMAKRAEVAESAWAEMRESQSATLAVPHTGQAVIIDVGEAADIHPLNKTVPGERLAQIALAKTYGKANIADTGPVYAGHEIKAGKVLIRFTPESGELVASKLGETYDVNLTRKETAPLVLNKPGSELQGFQICGADRQWVWADAAIEGGKVAVWSDKVAAPVAVRYGWADNPTVNLFNKAGLPASPFRTDDFPAITEKKSY